MSKRWSERGAAAVEFALVAPVLILLVVGIMEFGRIYDVQTRLSGAAREGVRTMALTSDVAAARTSAKNAAGSLALTDSQIAVTPSTCVASANATVTITYSYKFLTGMFGANHTLTGKGYMRCNG